MLVKLVSIAKNKTVFWQNFQKRDFKNCESQILEKFQTT